MSEDPFGDTRDVLEAVVWRAGYTGTTKMLDELLAAVVAWVQGIVDDWAADVQRTQTTEVADLQRQITELRTMPRSVGMGHGPGDLSERSDFVPGACAAVENADYVRDVMDRAQETERFATDDAPDPYPVPEVAYEEFPDTWNDDPYGDALMAALEEAAEEQEIGGYVDVPGHGPVYLAPDADFQPLPIPYAEFYLTETDRIRIHPADYGILREYLRGPGDAYDQALQARDVHGLEAELAAVKEAVAANPGVVLTGSAGPWPRACRTCKQVLGQEEFKRDRSMADGYRSDCKTCIRKRNRDRQQRKAQESSGAPTA